MRKRRVSLGPKTLIVGTVIGISSAYFPAARGQAIVTYGVNVGRAAGTGAAAGAGAAGIFDKLNRTTAKAANHEATGKPVVKPATGPIRKPASPNAITIGGNKAADAVREPGVVHTASGISIAGLFTSKSANNGTSEPETGARDVSASATSGATAEPAPAPQDISIPAVPLADPAPVAPAAKEAGGPPAARPEAPQDVREGVEIPAAIPAKPAPVAPKEPAPVIAEGITPKAGTATRGVDPSTIAPGTPMPDVVKLLGQPLMRLSGVEGADYEERYVFLTADGSKLTVLAKDGLVLKVIVE